MSFPPNVRSGLSTKVFCTVEKGSKPLRFQWKFNGKNIQESDKTVVIATYDDFSVLNVDPVSSKHSGNYTCVVKNQEGEDSYTVPLIVQGNIQILINALHFKIYNKC